MTRLVMLDPSHHAGLCLDPVPRGGAAALVQIGRSEIPLAIADHPLFLAKDGTSGHFGIVALVGLMEPRNLFWRDGRWAATYLPEMLFSSPFRLSAESPTGLVVDRDDDRLGRVGEPLFAPDGTHAPALIRERERLQRIVADVEDARRTAAALVAAGLIRPATVTLRFKDGSPHLLEGLYTPDREALAAMTEATLAATFRSGDLAAALLMEGSLCQLERLRQLHNREPGGLEIETAEVS